MGNQIVLSTIHPLNIHRRSKIENLIHPSDIQRMDYGFCLQEIYNYGEYLKRENFEIVNNRKLTHAH